MKDCNIILKIINDARKHPDKIALIITRKVNVFRKKTTRYTYRQIVDDVKRTALNLTAQGFNKGDRIIVFVPMSYELYIIVMAILYIGAVAVFMDAWANRKRLADACIVAEPNGFIGIWKAHILRIVPEIRKIPHILFTSQIVKPASENDAHEIKGMNHEPRGPEDEALVTLTTGTTGLPKGAKRTHGILWEQFLILGDHLKLKKDDIDLTALPVFILNNLGLGITSILPLFNPAKPADFNPAHIAEQISDYRITTSMGSPSFYEKLADYAIQRKINLPLRKIFTGGAPVFRPLAEKLALAFPETDIDIVYGCTEAEPISHIPLRQTLKYAPDQGIPVGKKVHDIEVRVIRASDDPVSIRKNETLNSYLVKKGDVGEIIIFGPHVLKEYIGAKDSFIKSKIVDGKKIWHRTGDAGRIDNDGNIFLMGRVKYRFKVGGKEYFPIPFEQRLRTLAEVTFAAVIQINERVYAVVESSVTGGKSRGLTAEIHQLLSEIMPVEVIITKKMPRDLRHISKIDYEKVKELIARCSPSAVTV